MKLLYYSNLGKKSHIKSAQHIEESIGYVKSIRSDVAIEFDEAKESKFPYSILIMKKKKRQVLMRNFLPIEEWTRPDDKRYKPSFFLFHNNDIHISKKWRE